MKAQARPIINDERRARIEKARRLMTQHKIDALMLTEGTSLVYFGEALSRALNPRLWVTGPRRTRRARRRRRPGPGLARQ